MCFFKKSTKSPKRTKSPIPYCNVCGMTKTNKSDQCVNCGW